MTQTTINTRKQVKSKEEIIKRNNRIIVTIVFSCIALILILIIRTILWDMHVSTLRKEVVRMIESGEIKITAGGIELPEKYRCAAIDKAIRIARKNNILWVEFRTDYVWADEFEGIIYSSNDREPPKTVFFWESSKVTYHRREPKWFSYLHE
jgi:hypothetical protein